MYLTLLGFSGSGCSSQKHLPQTHEPRPEHSGPVLSGGWQSLMILSPEHAHSALSSKLTERQK